MHNNSRSPRTWAVLAVCLAVSLACMIMYSREDADGALHRIQGAFGTVSSPFAFVGSAVGSAGEGASAAIGDATASDDELSALRAQNEELREMVAQGEEYRQEAERLQQLLHLSDTYDVEGVAARVVGRSIDAWNQTVTVDVGENDGVDAGQTVMGPSGVVGQVVSTTKSTAHVRLLTDPQSGVAVVIQSSRAEGIVKGSLEGVLYLEDVGADVTVNVGDVVVTSGLGGSYVRGLIVGTVVKVDQNQGDSSRRIVVAPNEETGPLQEVLVVKAIGSEGAAAAAGAAQSGDAA